MCNLSEGIIQKAVEETKEKYMAELAKKDEELAAMQTKGESKMAALISAMSVNGDTENIAKVAADPSFREKMYAKYGIQ